MNGHGNKKGMTLRQLAISSGDKTYHGKACKCGSTLKFTETRCCASCNGNSPEARGKSAEVSDVFAMASRAFKVKNERG